MSKLITYREVQIVVIAYDDDFIELVDCFPSSTTKWKF